jgi:4-aminobutyrate aminotransferase / (S)-3-amino-2-methylpropionate transaminase / 5-aminovalerate transaminase
MDLYGPAEMTSTHTGNPVCAVAALASIRKIVEGGLVKNAAEMGEALLGGLRAVAGCYPSWKRRSRKDSSSLRPSALAAPR